MFYKISRLSRRLTVYLISLFLSISGISPSPPSFSSNPGERGMKGNYPDLNFGWGRIHLGRAAASVASSGS